MAHISFAQKPSPRKYLTLIVFVSLSFSLTISFYETRPVFSAQTIVKRIEKASNDFIRVEFNVSSITPTCRNDDVLLIYILSTSTNFVRRENIRSTWASKLNGTCFVFIVGNVANGSEIQKQIDAEQQEYRDLVQINYAENYRHLIYKEVAALLWSAQHYRNISYLFKTDDDLIVDSILLSSIAQYLLTNDSESMKYISKYRRELFDDLSKSDRSNFFRSGWEMVGQPSEFSEAKFGISSKIWSEKILPPYCSGFGWMMSSQIRDKLVQASQIYRTENIVWIGDVFLSGFLARAAQVRCTRMLIDYEQIDRPRCPCLFFENPMLTICSSTMHAGVPASDDPDSEDEFFDSWQVIVERHSPPSQGTIMFMPQC